MFIPWSQFRANNVLEVQAADTVAQVRDRLLALGGHAQHLSALVVHLPDGGIVPTTASQLKELAKKHGQRILGVPIGTLTQELCPLPWEIEDQIPQCRRAMAVAAPRQLPIIVAQDGQRLGLYRPRREVESHRSSHGLSFDLFDRSVPEASAVPFVWFPESTPLARIVRDLEPYRQAPLVYVLIRLAGGRFKLSTKAGLERAMAALGQVKEGTPAESWTLPLKRLEDAFSAPIQVQDWEDVSGVQAKNLSRSRALVLTRDGIPAVLYPGGSRNAFSHSTARNLHYDRDAVPNPPVDDLAAAPSHSHGLDTEPRFVNLWFESMDQRVVGRGQALMLGQDYYLTLNVGRLLQVSIIDRDRSPADATAIVEPQAEEALLYISLYSEDFAVAEPTQGLRLPRAGDTRPVRFQVTPLHRHGGTGPATLQVCLYYRTHLVQAFQVHVEIAAAGETPHTAQPQMAQLVHARTYSFPDMANLPPRELSLTIARDGIDRYRFTFLVNPDSEDGTATEPGSATSHVMGLSCHVHLTRDDLTHLITKARRQLYNVVRTFDLLQDHDARSCNRATRALAQVGRQLYLNLFATSSARALQDWMEESLPDGSTIQVVDLAGDFVFPWSLIYTSQPWDDDEPIDVAKFWGWRYELVILTSALLDTYRRSEAVIATDDPLRVSVGLYERLLGAAQQTAFFAELNANTNHQVQSETITDKRKMGQALTAADRDLYYFFCHGFTERIATDIQLGTDLVSQFAQLAAQSIGSRSQSVSEHLDDLFDVSDSWLRLTRGKIPLTMLKETIPAEFKHHPLVFLNMCESAQVLPSLSDGFVPFFLQRGARAVIGTECPMNTVFGDDFARAFLTLFLQGMAVGEILLTLRRRYLKVGNPLALAYTLYSDADLRLDRQLLPSGKEPQAIGRREPSASARARLRAIDALWEDDMDGLMLTLAARIQAEQNSAAATALQMWDPPEVVFAAEVEAGPEWTAMMLDFAQEWWNKLEPQLYEVLCNKDNPQHRDLVEALQDGIKMLAATLAPALVAQVATLPAIAIVVATIAAKKIAESGLEAVCVLWADTMAQASLTLQAP